MSKPSYFIASDYAGIKTDLVDLYFGYETADESGEWCFQAKLNGGVVATIPHSKLPGKPDAGDCVACLLSGIAALLEKEQLVLLA